MGGLAALGGIGLGISRGARDIRDWEEEKFRKTQRARLLKDQADEDSLKGKLSAVKPEGEYTEELRGAPGEQEAPTLVKGNRTGEQVMRERAGIYQQAGKDDAANTLLTRAEMMKDRAAKQDTMKRIMEGRAEYDKDPISWGVKHYNGQVPDGKILSPFSTPDGRTVADVVDMATGKREGQLNVNKEMAEAAFRTWASMQMAGTNDPEVFMRGMLENARLGEETKRTGIAQQGLGLRSREVSIAEGNADSQRKMWGAQAFQATEHGNLYKRTDPNIRAGSGAGGAGKPFKLKVMVSDDANPGKKVPVEIVMTTDKDGNRKFMDATGRDVTNDPRIQKGIQGATEDEGIDEQYGVMLAKTRDAYAKGDLDDASYDGKMATIIERREYAKLAAEYRRSSPEERKVLLDTLLENENLTPQRISQMLSISTTVVNGRRAELKQLGIKKRAADKAEEQRILTAPRNPRPAVVPGEVQPDTP